MGGWLCRWFDNDSHGKESDNMQATLSQIAALVNGKVIGDGDIVVHGAAPLADAKPDEITLLEEDADRHHKLVESRAKAVVATHSQIQDGLAVIQVEDVHAAFSTIVEFFNPKTESKRIGISPLAVVSPTAKLGKDVDVHPYATIGENVEIGDRSTIHAGVHIMADVMIGDNVTIFPNAVLYERTVIGSRCIIHSGVVLGAYGFGYQSVDGRHKLSSQYGNVIVGPDVEIGATTTIDRGTYGPTSIGKGTKIDNMVMIAHNCRIGCHNMLCSQVGIAGSTTTGDYVVMAGQVGVRDHVHIGTGAVIGAMAGIINDVSDGLRMIGVPATPERDQKIKQAAFSKLPEMRRQLKKLQSQVDKLIEVRDVEQNRLSEKDGPVTQVDAA